MNEGNVPVVSIAMPVFNGARTLRAALCSLLLQTYRNWELLLIDDGSSDDTPLIAGSFCDPRIRVFVDNSRKGHGRRLNEAIDLANGKYIARMDQDDICFPERLAAQVDFMEANPSIDLLATRALVFADDGSVKGLFPFRGTHAEICQRPTGGFYLPHPTWLGRSEWFRKFRYVDSNMPRAEDQDLLLRSYRTSAFACLNDVLLGYRQNELPMNSILAGRRSFRRAVIRESLRNGRYGDIPIVVVEQAVKGAFEWLASSLGIERFLLRHRVRSGVDEPLLLRWQKIWQQCQTKGEECASAT